MHLDTEKLNVIKKILKVDNEATLDKLASILKERKVKKAAKKKPE